MAQEGGFAVLAGGLEYRMVRTGGKRKPKTGEVCTLHMQYLSETDSVLFDSRDFGEPLVQNMQKPDFVGGVESGIALMAEGDSAIFKVNADSLFEKTFLEDLPPEIAPGSKIIYRVGLVKVRSVDEILDEEEKIEKDKKAAIEKRKDNESQSIKQYLKLNQIEAKPFESGAILVMVKRGKGKVAVKGRKVSFLYTARTLDGSLFDTNIEAEANNAGVQMSDRTFEPLEITMGAKEVFPGLEEGLSHIQEGGKARLIIPSSLAYGSLQVGSLLPYSPLVYEIEVLEVK
jgi:FKBP-type peptidyl-prolyl cis-trans isomerase